MFFPKAHRIWNYFPHSALEIANDLQIVKTFVNFFKDIKKSLVLTEKSKNSCSKNGFIDFFLGICYSIWFEFLIGQRFRFDTAYCGTWSLSYVMGLCQVSVMERVLNIGNGEKLLSKDGNILDFSCFFFQLAKMNR